MHCVRRQDVSELFAAFDTDEDGLVTAHELLGAVTLAASMARTQDRAKRKAVSPLLVC